MGTIAKGLMGAESEEQRAFSIWQALEVWGRELRPWQQHTLATIVRENSLYDDQIEQIYQIFLQENGLAVSTATPTALLTQISPRPIEAAENNILLSGIRNLQHVNALPSSTQLTFGTSLTIVYGQNGAGKSSFVRVMANVCFSRSCPPIRPNIYSDGEPGTPQVELVISDGAGNESVRIYDGTTDHAELKRFSVFNSDVARIHLADRNTFSVKPAGFDVFNEMSRVYRELMTKLTNDISQKDREQGFSSSFLSPESPISQMVSNIGPDSNLDELKALAVYGPVEEVRLAEITQQIEELKRQGVAETIKQLDQAKTDLQEFALKLEQARQSFKTEVLQEYFTKLTDVRQKEAAAAQMSSEQFKQAFFRGVGTPAWEGVLLAAKQLGQEEDESYPAEGHHCLLCHSPLTQHSIDLINRCWEYLSSTARQEASTAKQGLESSLNSLKRLSLDLLPQDSRVRTHLIQHAPHLLESTDTLIQALSSLRDKLVLAIESGQQIEVAEPVGLNQQFTELIAQIVADQTTLQGQNVEQAVQAFENERVIIRHREVLSKQIAEIERYILDQRWVRSVEPAKRQLNTTGITNKQKQLFESVVGVQYRQTLREECEKLRCLFPLELAARGDSGQTVRTLTLPGGHQPHDILSEGEQRAVALADFLTEVSLNPAAAGVILDDPVNSQDHARKKWIAQRLIQEAQVRQVIVFTHDLVFLALLNSYCKDVGLNPSTHWVQQDGDGNPGLVTLEDCPVTTKQYLKTTLAQQSLQKARSCTGSEQVDAIRDGMGKLRRTIEEIIPQHLFKGVIPRWEDRVIVTKLPRISWDDSLAEELVETFEELSAFIEGHSHTDESMGAPPTVQELETYITRVNTLIDRVKPDRRA
jgi:energy-coupling factor transporter ATP-binding protein EcfA2